MFRMNRRRVLKGVMAAAAALPLAGCWLFSGGEWKKKITVTVATPAGDVSGSVVRWEKMTEDPVLSSSHSQERGEAVVVEVAKGRYLFALIEDNKPQDELLFFPDEPPLESTGKLSRRKGEVIEVPITHYPMLVTFGDLNDPKSVRQVLPDELAKHFGAGVTLKSITLEITDEPMTEGAVEKVLPWIKTHEGRMRPPSLRLGPGLHNAADVLPIEKIEEIDFRRNSQ
jgi:hypothetical protein